MEFIEGQAYKTRCGFKAVCIRPSIGGLPARMRIDERHPLAYTYDRIPYTFGVEARNGRYIDDGLDRDLDIVGPWRTKNKDR